MSQITTHVLDAALGTPAQGVPIRLSQKHGTDWQVLAQGVTNKDGRITDLLPASTVLAAGDYQMYFNTQLYLQTTQQAVFYPEVSIVFTIAADGQHYHIPLLLSPYGYSTYRGS